MSAKDVSPNPDSSLHNKPHKKKRIAALFFRALLPVITLVAAGLLSWIMYPCLKAIQRDGEKLKANLAFIDINRALNNYKPLTISDIRQQMSSQSAEITKEFGGKDLVIILPSDPKSDFFLVNYPNKLDAQSNYPDHGDGGTTTRKLKYLNNPVGRYFFDFTKEDWNFLIDRSYMFSNSTTANVNRSGLDDGQSVAFLRPESPTNFIEDSPRAVPYATTLEELNQWAFFHEMTHAHDQAVHTRNYLDTTQKYGMDIDEDTGQLIAESIADTGAALIALRVTENMDTFKFLIRPMRFRDPGDNIHSTQHVSDAVLREISLVDVKGKSDIELMILAERLVDLYVIEEVKKYQEAHYWLFSSSLSDNLLNIKSGMFYPAADMMSESSSAIEASLQNLLYQGQFRELFPELDASIRKHIFKFFDYAMMKAYWKATHGRIFSHAEDFNLEAFSTEMHYAIDYSARERKDQNNKKLHDYYISATNNRLGFDQHDIIDSRLKLEMEEFTLMKNRPKQSPVNSH